MSQIDLEIYQNETSKIFLPYNDGKIFIIIDKCWCKC